MHGSEFTYDSETIIKWRFLKMSVGFNFSDYFGIDVPMEKEEKKVEKKAKKTTEKKDNSKKKTTTEKKYSLPVVVHSEWGDLKVEGLGEMSLKEIKKNLELPKVIKLKEIDDELFAMDDLTNVKTLKKSDSIDGMIFIEGQWITLPNEMTVKEAVNFITKEYPELPGDNIDICSFENGKYVIKFSNSIDLSMKFYSHFRMGFVGNLISYDFIKENNPSISLKEAISEFTKEKPWTKKVEMNWFFNEKSKSIIGKVVDNSNLTTKSLYVKLPAAIRFIHDAGPLKNGLTPDMFDGKEYVTDKEILKIVLKYFPDIYKDGNTDISYAEAVNTVCVLRQGRSKGSGSLIGCLNSEGEYAFKLPKMPKNFLEEITNYFIENLPNEALVQIAFDCKTEEYRIIKPKTVTNTVSVKWNDIETLLALNTYESIVCEIHSHDTMPAFFSYIDDEDEKIPMIYGVFGRLDTQNVEKIFRAKLNEKFYPIKLSDIFNL